MSAATSRLSSLSLGALTLLAAQFSAIPSEAGQIASISGAYDLCIGDSPCLVFHNTSGYDFTGAQMVLHGYNGLNAGLTETIGLPDMTAGSDTTILWDQNFIQPHTLFAQDYDDEYYAYLYSSPYCDLGGYYCSPVGNFSVTFTATWNGESIYSQFSPDDNATGGFVCWEGVNQAGWSEDSTCDVHSGSVTGVLAYIYEGTPPVNPQDFGTVPEPLTLSLFGAGLAGAVAMRRRKKKAA